MDLWPLMYKKTQSEKKPAQANITITSKMTLAPSALQMPQTQLPTVPLLYTASPLPFFTSANASLNPLRASEMSAPPMLLQRPHPEMSAHGMEDESSWMAEVEEATSALNDVNSPAEDIDWRMYKFRDKDETPLSADDRIFNVGNAYVADHYFADIKKWVTLPITRMKKSGQACLIDYQGNKLSLDQLKTMELEITGKKIRCFIQDRIADGKTLYQQLYQYKDGCFYVDNLYEKLDDDSFNLTAYKATPLVATRQLSEENKGITQRLVETYRNKRASTMSEYVMATPSSVGALISSTENMTVPVITSVETSQTSERRLSMNSDLLQACTVSSSQYAKEDYYIPVIEATLISVMEATRIGPDAEIYVVGPAKLAKYVFAETEGKERLEVLVPVTNAMDRANAIYVDGSRKQISLAEIKTLVITIDDRNLCSYYIVSHKNEAGVDVYKEIGHKSKMLSRCRFGEIAYYVRDASGTAMQPYQESVKVSPASSIALSGVTREFLTHLHNKKQKASEYVREVKKTQSSNKANRVSRSAPRQAVSINTLPQTLISQLEARHKQLQQEKEIAELSALLGLNDDAPAQTMSTQVLETLPSTLSEEASLNTVSNLDELGQQAAHQRKHP